MIQNKKYLAWPGILFFAFTLCACNDDPEVKYVGDMKQYQKAYITTGVGASAPQEFSMSFGELIEKDDKLEFTPTQAMLTPAESYSETDIIYFRTTYPVKTRVSGILALRDNAEEYVEQYNDELELDDETGYRLLPPEWYTLEGNPAVINSGQKEAVIRVVPKTGAAWATGKYLMPLSLTLEAESSAALSENMSDLCHVVHVVEKYPENSRLLTADDYSVNTLSGSGQGNQTVSSDNTYKNAFDQDPETVWTPGYRDSTVEIEFDEPHYLSHVFVVMGSSNGWLTGLVYVYAKTEDEDTSAYKNKSMENKEGLGTFNIKDLGLDSSKKVDKVKIRNSRGNIKDVYFLVHD